MKDFLQWILKMVCFLCFFQVFLQLVPKESYRKFLKFFGSLLLILMVARPIAVLINQDGEWERILKEEIRKGEYSELMLHMEGVEDLDTEVVTKAFQQEITRQIRKIPEVYGFQVEGAEVLFDESGMKPEKVTLDIWIGEEGFVQVEEMEWEICSIYQLERKMLTVRVEG